MNYEKKLNSRDLINKFSNYLIKNGKKKKVKRILSKSLREFTRKNNIRFKSRNFLTFVFIIFRIRPTMSLKTIKRGSDFYIFPSPFKNYKSLKLVLFWISKIVKSRREYLLLYRIKYELANILKYEGATWKHYKLFQKKVSENILYSHFRWV